KRPVRKRVPHEKAVRKRAVPRRARERRQKVAAPRSAVRKSAAEPRQAHGRADVANSFISSSVNGGARSIAFRRFALKSPLVISTHERACNSTRRWRKRSEHRATGARCGDRARANDLARTRSHRGGAADQ